MQTKYNKELYKEYKRTAKEHDIRFFTVDTTDQGYEYNGVSIAYTPRTYDKDCRMLAVSVSYCAPEDKFKPKHGKFQALNKMYNGEFVQMPLAEFYRRNGINITEEMLENMFVHF